MSNKKINTIEHNYMASSLKLPVADKKVAVNKKRYLKGIEGIIEKTKEFNKEREKRFAQSSDLHIIRMEINNPPMSPEELAIIELTEILKESNAKIEALQQKYKLNVESIIFSEELKESLIVRALKKEIARKVGHLLEMMPTFLRKFIIGERYAKSDYRKNNISSSDTSLILPKPNSQKYVRWADRNKPERWPDKKKYDQWAKLVASKKDTAINFFNLNWHNYVEAALLYQTNLRGSQSVDNPKEGLDPTLFNLLKEECKKQKIPLPNILPNNMKKSTNRLKNNIIEQMVA